MSLNKRTYTDYDSNTPITATNLNEIQQEIINTCSYAICDSSAGTVIKTVNIPNFVLAAGATVKIKFNNTNTATNPTLNVSGTGEKAIVNSNGTNVGKTIDTSWVNGEIVELVYNGSNWVRQVRSIVAAISDSYSSNKTYKVGQLCIYDNLLYKCNTAITTAEAWTPSHWTLTSIAKEIEDKTLWFSGVTVSASSGYIVDLQDARITANHIVVFLKWSNKSHITTAVSWTTSSGRLRISGTCNTAMTVDILLVKNNN